MIIVRGVGRVYSHSAQLGEGTAQRRNHADSRDPRGARVKAHPSIAQRIHISTRAKRPISAACPPAMKP